MEQYRIEILENIRTEISPLLWEELPELTREFFGVFGKVNPWKQYPEYLGVELNDYQLIIGFGDSNPDYWDGTIFWSISKDFATDNFYSGEIRNGSPKYILWELFADLEEQLKKGAN